MTSWCRLAFALLAPSAGVASCIGEAPTHFEPTEDAGAPDSDSGANDPPDARPDTDADAPPGPDPDPTSRSGTRLRRHYLEAGPSAMRTLEFWDTELDVACTFQPAADATLRCLPRLDSAYFTDSSCTGQVVMLTNEQSCERLFGRVPDRDPIYRRTTTPRALDAMVLYYPSGGTCLGTHVSPEAKAWIAEQIPSIGFVEGAERDEPRSGGMVARYVDGVDGSRMLSSVHDVSRDSVCNFTVEPGRCMPSRREPASLFSDASCTSRVASSSSATKPDVLFESQRDANGCPTGTEYFAVGAAVASAAPLYVRIDGACVAYTRRAGESYYHRGTPISLSSFPEAKVGQEGAGRIRALRRFDSEGKPLGQAYAFWDSERDVECTAARLSDGTFRCVPSTSGPGDSNWFGDPACSSQPLGEFHCAATPGPYIVTLATGWNCMSSSVWAYERVYERGAEVTGLAYHRGATCQAQGLRPTSRFFGLGRVVAPSELPELVWKKE